MSTATELTTPTDLNVVSGIRAARPVWQRRYEMTLRITDVSVVFVAVAFSQWLRFGAVPGVGASISDLNYWIASTTVICLWVFFLSIYRTRTPRILGAGPEEYRRVLAATLSAFGALATVSLLFRLDFARGYLAIALPLGLFGLLFNRWLVRRHVARQWRKGKYLTSVLVVAEQPGPARALVQSLARMPENGYKVVGVCFPGRGSHKSTDHWEVDDVPEFAFDDDLSIAIAASGADTVALTAIERLGQHDVRDLSWQLEQLDIDLVVSPGIVGLAGPRLTMRPVADLPLIHIEKPQYDGAKRFQKGAFDVCFAAMILLAVSPVMVVAAIAVKLSSKGPVFIKSDRIGMDGRPFKMIKIRTMFDSADTQRPQIAEMDEVDGGVIVKIRQDPRITPVGRLLRRYSIDELPQFMNVLRREMSVVGPRPPRPSEVEAYDQRVRRRLLVRPGVTGLWQVSGRSDLSWDDLVRLDLLYVENWSMMSDVVIAVKTVRAVLSGAGAY
jgi:exopolysaccharide biosynthesis polyprenyl glycosylphosphotransferase